VEKINIICVDDEREVQASLKKDLVVFKEYFAMHFCESAAEATELLDELDADGEHIALLICDHIMPGKNGVEFLSETNDDSRFKKTRKLLLTGLATHQDTIIAINKANISCYVEKPWTQDGIIKEVKILLTEYVVEAGIEYQSFIQILDQETLYKALSSNV